MKGLFPILNADELGSQLVLSFRVDDGASVTPQCKTDAAAFNDKLKRHGLLELRNEAASFFRAVGTLETD